VTLIIDSGPLVALADRRDPMQQRVQRLLVDEPGILVVPAAVTAEVDYLLGHRLGRIARLAFLDDLAAGRFDVACLDEEEYRAIRTLDAAYADLDAGLADLSIVVLADRFRTHRVLTFDERHFRALRPLDGAPAFEILPVSVGG
jgi:hypothetical protein